MTDLSRSQFEHSHTAFTRRSSERIPLIRTAKLIVEDGEYPCVLRDISSSSLRVKLYGAPLPGDNRPFWLEFGDGERFEVSRLWERGGQAGLAFTAQQSLLSLLGEKGQYRKRAIRIAVDIAGSITTPDHSGEVRISDLSHEGAQVACDQILAIDQQVRLKVPALGETVARVRWRRHPEYGLAFVETFRFDEVAALAPRLQELSRQRRSTSTATHALRHIGEGDPPQLPA